jgi:hypothetical protein
MSSRSRTGAWGCGRSTWTAPTSCWPTRRRSTCRYRSGSGCTWSPGSPGATASASRSPRRPAVASPRWWCCRRRCSPKRSRSPPAGWRRSASRCRRWRWCGPRPCSVPGWLPAWSCRGRRPTACAQTAPSAPSAPSATARTPSETVPTAPPGRAGSRPPTPPPHRRCPPHRPRPPRRQPPPVPSRRPSRSRRQARRDRPPGLRHPPHRRRRTHRRQPAPASHGSTAACRRPTSLPSSAASRVRATRLPRWRAVPLPGQPARRSGTGGGKLRRQR